ncbi:UNVERIFIED_CONTAM: Retrovirus-related Pol polyprotein from transposon RE2 [Sesamum indicum]
MPHKSKFDVRAVKCVFLGYASNKKGYKVYDLKGKCMIVSRDITFYEDVFPYAKDSDDPITCTLPVTIYDDNLDEEIFEEPDIVTDNDTEVQENSNQNTNVIRRFNRQRSQPKRLQDFICSHADTNLDISAIIHSPHIHKCLLAAGNNPTEPSNFNEAIKKLPKDKRATGCKWVYKLKLKQDGTIDRFKARLVAKGYNQIEGIDYLDSFSRVAKAVTVRTLLAIAAKQNWHIHQLDINNAFLHGFLDEEIYMFPPEGCSVLKGHVCQGKELCCLRHKTKYINDIITDLGLSQARAANTPLPAGINLCKTDEEQLQNPELYRRLIGRLLYLGFTRPDICHGTQQLSQHMQFTCKSHWNAAIHLVRYLKGTANRGLLFDKNDDLELKAYSDANWASCKDTRRSLTGYCIFIEKALISWKTKKQTIVSRSSAEAEYRSMATTTCELVWIFNLLQDLQIVPSTPIQFFCDNQDALYITTNPVFIKGPNILK